MKTTYHLCMSIDGAIENARMLKGCITTDDGKTLQTVAEIRQFLYGQKALGRRVLPMCDCDNFDYQTGCRGHKQEEE